MIYPFIFSLIASVSTLLGIIPIFIKKFSYRNIIAFSLAFAAGVMITMSILDLIPEGIRYLRINNNKIIFISVIVVLIANIIVYYFNNILDKYSNNKLYNTGLLAIIGVTIHNIPEGIITYIVSSRNITLGIMICLAITLHNIPEGISIATPIYYATKSKFKAIFLTFISGFSEFFGAILTHIILNKYITTYILGIMLLFTAGIMIGIAYLKLLPSSIKYNRKLAFNSFIIGIFFITISLLINSLVF